MGLACDAWLLPTSALAGRLVLFLGVGVGVGVGEPGLGEQPETIRRCSPEGVLTGPEIALRDHIAGVVADAPSDARRAPATSTLEKLLAEPQSLGRSWMMGE